MYSRKAFYTHALDLAVRYSILHGGGYAIAWLAFKFRLMEIEIAEYYARNP